MKETNVDSRPESLILNDLELKPYQYKEQRGSIDARIILSEDQYAQLGKMKAPIKVIRSGIDNEPRTMKLIEIAWSKDDHEIKEQIMLSEVKGKEKIGALPSLRNLQLLVAEQSLIIDELLSILVLDNIVGEDKIKEIKTKITEGRIWNRRRDLNRVHLDLDEYRSLEE